LKLENVKNNSIIIITVNIIPIAIEAIMIRLLIVADQPSVRKGLQMRLAAETDFSVIGEASDSGVALDLARTLCPDIVLIDMDMPHMDGIALTGELHQFCPQAALIILSINDDVSTCARAENAGATALIAKSMPADTLLTTIRHTAHFLSGGV
jgi:DNA-binding NarL/FixJ family response regulator